MKATLRSWVLDEYMRAIARWLLEREGYPDPNEALLYERIQQMRLHTGQKRVWLNRQREGLLAEYIHAYKKPT